MSFVCEKCGNSFVTKYTLKKHISSAKYCAKIDSFSCECCSYQTTDVQKYEEHIQTCESGHCSHLHLKIDDLTSENEKKDLELKECLQKLKTAEEENKTLKLTLEKTKKEVKTLKTKIDELKYKNALSEGQITVYKERPGNVTNNNNQYVNKLLQVKCGTIRPFTIETVRDDVKDGKYTFERYIQGEKGVLDFISDIISQDDQRSYVCTDSSRHRFHRLLESREWKDDNGATFLNKVLDELKTPTVEYYNKIADMMVSGDQELADILMDKTKTMALGIINPKSKDRETTFTKIRNEVRKLSTI